MKRFFKYLFLIVLFAGIGGFIYWQIKKHKIIKESIQNSVNKNTDNLYYIHYDSSMIDELAGTAAFYNVSLQSDSVQKNLLKKADSLPNAIFTIRAKEISASGIDVPGLLTQENVSAARILVNKPFIQVINTGSERLKPFTKDDTLALYQKIIGRFKSIKADTIEIKDGTVIVSDITGKPLTTLEGINILLYNFLVDSTRNYENVISYFIKDVRVTVDNIQLPVSKNNIRTNIGKLDYNAVNKTLSLGEIQQYKINDMQAVTDLKHISLTGLSTDSFIQYHHLKAADVKCAGGLITIYTKEGKDSSRTGFLQFSSDLVDAVEVGAVKLGNTKIIIVNTSRPAKIPFVLNDVQLTVSKILKLTHGNTVNDLINNAEWKFQLSGFSFLSPEKAYKLTATSIEVDNTKSFIHVKSFAVTPLLSEAAFMKQKKYNGDRYDFRFNDINASGIDFKKLLTENKIEIQKFSLQPILKIYNDRTLPVDPKEGEILFPFRSLLRLKTKIYIAKLDINKGYVAYKERGEESGLTGTLTFNNINATIDNLTNIRERIVQNPNCRLIADAMFLNKGKMHTEWRLPLTPADSIFTVIGQLEEMDAAVVNPVTEPLALVSVKKGKINDLKFSFAGSTYGSKGEVIFLYNNLNVQVLKKNPEEAMDKKGLLTFIANLLIKNNNPQNGNTRTGHVDYSRDIRTSFFNLLWKSVFTGVKKTVSGMN